MLPQPLEWLKKEPCSLLKQSEFAGALPFNLKLSNLILQLYMPVWAQEFFCVLLQPTPNEKELFYGSWLIDFGISMECAPDMTS